MEHSHLPLETLARWLAGRLEHDQVLQVVVPHHLERCPDCREKHEEILRLQAEIGHWDEEVAVVESREAPELWSRLAEHQIDDQLKLVDEDEGLHAWGLCNFLLKKSLAAVFDNPAQAVDLADLALRVSQYLGSAYDPHWVLDLRARAFAYLANARRVLGELKSADAAFRKAEICLRRSTTGNLKVEAELLDLKSSLRRDQRRLPEALALSDRSLTLYRESGDSHGLAIALLKKAKILEEAGDLVGSIDLLQQGSSEIDRVREPRLYALARYNLLGCFTFASRLNEAEKLLPEVRNLFRETAQPLDLVRLRWAEGNIALGLDRIQDAEHAFREVQKEFLDRGMAFNAALVSLDLAGLLAQEERRPELKQLAAELMPVFESREIHREALGTLILFERACQEERLTVELARELAGALRQERRGRAAG